MTTRQTFDCAVTFACDRNFYHLTLFVIWQIAHHNPNRRFDFIIASQDDLEVPGWAKSLGLTIHRSGPLPDDASVARLRGSLAPIYRLQLARELGDRYRRILYLDSDLFIEGGDINRLFEMDIGDHPLGMVLDAPYLMKPNFHAAEFVRAVYPAHPYGNTGVQLIDTRAYREQEVERRSFEVCKTHPDAIIYSEQSLTNLALKGGFARLAPCWNWQLNGRYPLMPMRYPVFIRHFVSPKKPDRQSTGQFDARFNNAYREFFAALVPEALQKLAPPCDPAPMSLGDVSRLVLRHVKGTGLMKEILRRHPDPYGAVL